MVGQQQPQGAGADLQQQPQGAGADLQWLSFIDHLRSQFDSEAAVQSHENALHAIRRIEQLKQPFTAFMR